MKLPQNSDREPPKSATDKHSSNALSMKESFKWISPAKHETPSKIHLKKHNNTLSRHLVISSTTLPSTVKYISPYLKKHDHMNLKTKTKTHPGHNGNFYQNHLKTMFKSKKRSNITSGNADNIDVCYSKRGICLDKQIGKRSRRWRAWTHSQYIPNEDKFRQDVDQDKHNVCNVDQGHDDPRGIDNNTNVPTLVNYPKPKIGRESLLFTSIRKLNIDYQLSTLLNSAYITNLNVAEKVWWGSNGTESHKIKDDDKGVIARNNVIQKDITFKALKNIRFKFENPLDKAKVSRYWNNFDKIRTIGNLRVQEWGD